MIAKGFSRNEKYDIYVTVRRIFEKFIRVTCKECPRFQYLFLQGELCDSKKNLEPIAERRIFSSRYFSRVSISSDLDRCQIDSSFIPKVSAAVIK